MTTRLFMVLFASLWTCDSTLHQERGMPFKPRPEHSYDLESQAGDVLAFDVDGDRQRDLVALAGSSPKVVVIYLDSKLKVKSRIELAAGPSASGIVAADFNEDGKQDLAIAHHDSDEIWILDGNDRSFATPRKVKIRVKKPHCHGLLAVDVNADSHLDLVLAQSDDNLLWVLNGDGRGQFHPSSDSPIITDNHPYVVTAADFEKDGKLDLATPNWFSRTVTTFHRNKDGLMALRSRLTGLKNPTALAAGDINGDGEPDMVVGSNGSGPMAIFFGDGKGSFRSGGALVPDAPCYGPVLADLDRDGDNDVIANATNGALTFSIWINDRHGRFSAPHALNCAAGANAIAVADLNGDRALDLIVGTWEPGSIQVWMGTP